jgi:periplasmic copper chaperone A
VPTRTVATRRVAVITSALLLTMAVGACGATTTSDPASTRSSSAVTAAALVLDDGWVKAVDAGGTAMSSPSSGTSTAGGMHEMATMTGLFGTLRNTSDRDITVTGGTSPAAGKVELHETVKNDTGAMQMQPKADGFTVPAGGTHVLQPGGDHVMLMGLTGPLANGTTTTLTLVTTAGDVVLTVPVRAFPGAEESYAPSPSHS